MIVTIGIFKQSCEMAAKKDDGQISKDEAKTLARITKAAESFKKELEALLNKNA